MPKKTYTVKEIANLLGFSTNTVYKYLDEGKIKAVRLGKEGRFRISSDEVKRLVPETETVIPSAIQGNAVSTISSIPTSPEVALPSTSRMLGFPRSMNAPSLFDWFTSVLAITLGAAEFLFPVYSLEATFTQYVLPVKILKIVLILLAVLLVSQDVFESQKKTWHKVIHIALALTFGAISIIFIRAGHVAHSVDYSIIAIVLLVTTFWKANEYIKFLIYINLITIFSGLFAFLQPRMLGVDTFLDWVMQNNVLFLIIWTFTVLSTLAWSSVAIKKGGIAAFGFNIGVSLASLLFSVVSFSSGSWERSVFLAVIAAFSLIFPYWDVFEHYTLKSKKQLIFAYFWLSALFIIGFLTLFVVNKTYESGILSEVQKRLNTAASFVEDFINDSETKVMVFSQDRELLTLIKTSDKSDDYEPVLKEFFMSSAGAFRRIIYTNKNGINISTYPVLAQSVGVDISSRNYFVEPKAGKRVFNSGIIMPSTPGVPPAVIISAPLLSSSGEFLGTISGSLDLNSLGDRLNQIKFGQNGNFVLIDSKKNYILHSLPNKIMTKVTSDSAGEAAVSGLSGTRKGYDSLGVLSLQAYKPVSYLKWGLVAQQPYSDAFAIYNIVGFVAFLVLVITGVASLVLIIHLGKSKQIG